MSHERNQVMGAMNPEYNLEEGSQSMFQTCYDVRHMFQLSPKVIGLSMLY